MRICIIITGFPPAFIGGTETQTCNVAAHLAKRHYVTVLTRREKGMPETSKERGFLIKRFRYLNFPIIRFFSHIISCLNEIRKIKENVDVFYCMMLSPNGLAGTLAKKMLGIKTVASVRGGDFYMTGFFGNMINRFVIKNSDLIVVQTEKIKRDVKQRYPDAKIGVVPNGVDITGERAKGKKIVFLGNLQERKGVKYLIQAVEKIDAKLLIAGDGEERESLERMVEETKLGKKVRFAGAVEPEDARKFLLQGQVLVLPSLVGEGLPNVILEAMSVGLPVVSTTISGIPDIIKDGRTGFLVEPGDSDSLAKAINKILNDKGVLLRMQKNCLKEVRRYFWAGVIKRLEDVISSV